MRAIAIVAPDVPWKLQQNTIFFLSAEGRNTATLL